MWRDRNKNQVSGIAMAFFAISAAAGSALAALLGNRAPLFAGVLVGVYLLFSLKVADQWEKVAVLRLGRYSGLRGPGLFHVIPIIDTLSRYVDQRVRVASVTAESTLTRHRTGECRRHRVLAGVERGKIDSRSGGFRASHHHERANRVARINRPPRIGADDHRTRIDGARAAAHSG